MEHSRRSKLSKTFSEETKERLIRDFKSIRYFVGGSGNIRKTNIAPFTRKERNEFSYTYPRCTFLEAKESSLSMRYGMPGTNYSLLTVYYNNIPEELIITNWLDKRTHASE